MGELLNANPELRAELARFAKPRRRDNGNCQRWFRRTGKTKRFKYSLSPLPLRDFYDRRCIVSGHWLPDVRRNFQLNQRGK